MLPRFSALPAFVALLALPLATPAAEPANLDIAKREIARYVASGEYGRKIAEIALRANRHILQRADAPKAGRKLAIVLDIDETALSNLSHIQSHGYGYNPKIWDAWVAEGRAGAIIPIQTVYENALRKGVSVFFITGRGEYQRASTERNLQQVGYETWTRAFFKPADSTQPLRLFKLETRRRIEADGYTIVANIGDQDGDLAGGHAERTFKLPNPFYLTH